MICDSFSVVVATQFGGLVKNWTGAKRKLVQSPLHPHKGLLQWLDAFGADAEASGFRGVDQFLCFDFRFLDRVGVQGRYRLGYGRL